VKVQPLLVAGAWEESPLPLTTRAPDTGEEVGRTFHATAEQLNRATEAAVEAFATTRALAAYERADMLRRIATGVTARADELALLLAREAGKPLADARTEVQRTAFTFQWAAEESQRLNGELIPLDVLPSSRGKWAITRRVPIGPVAGISPFNLPLSLSAHKLAPAIAVGDPIVLKPDSRTACTVLALAEVMAEAGVPAGALSVLPMEIEVADAMVTDDRFALLSFTGSARVGWDMKARAGRKPVVLELGGNAAVIVDADADLDLVMSRLLVGAFKYAGQICISVQRVLVHRSRADELRDRLVQGAESLRVGAATDPGVEIGPMISEQAARAAKALVDEAVAGGARLLAGGRQDGSYLSPTVLDGAPEDAAIVREEAFAPVVSIQEFDDIEAAYATVNAGRFGLQTGVFTRDLTSAWRAFDALEVGGVIINDVPTFRVDHMAYGGVKDSGLGREGVRYAIEHMTELRTMVFTAGG